MHRQDSSNPADYQQSGKYGTICLTSARITKSVELPASSYVLETTTQRKKISKDFYECLNRRNETMAEKLNREVYDPNVFVGSENVALGPRKHLKRSRPLKEIRRQMWSEALGDLYWEAGTNSSQKSSGAVEIDAGTLSSSLSALEHSIQNMFDISNPFGCFSSSFSRCKDGKGNRKRNRYRPLTTMVVKCAPSNHNVDNKLTERVPSDLPGDVPLNACDFPQRVPAETKQMVHVGTPRFSIVCSGVETWQAIREKVLLLKGKVCENRAKLNEVCTHILCERPSRREIILCGVASGKWILNQSYIEASLKSGDFVNEELFEWGNPKAINLPKLTTIDQSVANAAFRSRNLRCSLKGQVKGAFHGFRVILHLCNMEESFQNLIVAGGGEVLLVKEPYAESKEALTATHCFVADKRQLLAEDREKLATAGVNLHPLKYLDALLMGAHS